jgi:hypothetical protein
MDIYDLDPSRTPAIVRSVTTEGIAFTIVQVGHFNGPHHEYFTIITSATFANSQIHWTHIERALSLSALGSDAAITATAWRFPVPRAIAPITGSAA